MVEDGVEVELEVSERDRGRIHRHRCGSGPKGSGQGRANSPSPPTDTAVDGVRRDRVRPSPIHLRPTAARPAAATATSDSPAATKRSARPTATRQRFCWRKEKSVLFPPDVRLIFSFARVEGPSVRRACATCHAGKTRCSEVLPCQVRSPQSIDHPNPEHLILPELLETRFGRDLCIPRA